MNEQAEIPQSSINKKTQQTEQQDASQTELKPSKYLALLVALFPHCLITPRNHAPSNGRTDAPPSVLGLTRQDASLEEGNLKSRRNFASQSKILTRELRILDRIDCRAKCFSLPQQTSRAGDQESLFPCGEKKLHQIFLLSASPRNGEERMPRLGASAAAQPSTVAVWQGSTAVQSALCS